MKICTKISEKARLYFLIITLMEIHYSVRAEVLKFQNELERISIASAGLIIAKIYYLLKKFLEFAEIPRNLMLFSDQTARVQLNNKFYTEMSAQF